MAKHIKSQLILSSPILLLLLLTLQTLSGSGFPSLPASNKQARKLDCYPIDGASKEKCEALGCIWEPVNNSKNINISEHSLPFDENDLALSKIPDGMPPFSDIKEPWCYFPTDYIGYEVHQDGPNIRLTLKRPSALGNDVKELAIVSEIMDSKGHILRLKIYDVNSQRFEPTLPKFNDLGKTQHSTIFQQYIDDQNNYIIKRKSTNEIVFSAELSKLIFADQFLQLNVKLDSPFVYGLGEHFDTFLKKVQIDRFKTYSFFHTDKTPFPNGRRSYGGFPFYINLEKNLKTAHGVYLHNSNAMDIILQPDNSITFRPIGGILDFFFFAGPTPHDVIKQYQNLVGLPALPPMWSLGFHLCRYNYGSIDKTKRVWQRTRNSGIPFDVQWNDIDYMDKHNDFTYDKDKFAGLDTFIRDSIHRNQMHYIILFDPGLSKEDDYYPYKLGEEMDVFIKNASGKTLVGKVWNDSGRTVFPDFSNPVSSKYWSKLFSEFHKEIPFDGAWIDMNDISNFVTGSLDGCPKDNYLENPPYKPGGYELQTKTLCLSAKHKQGYEYDLHNLYSFYESIATYKALQEARPNKRPFVISRSTSPGQGAFGGHWSGDVLSNWDYLRWSIPSLIEHSMYGYSMMGTDICGFIGDTNVELCSRWSTLGAFYTFSRNHNDDVSIDQDPVALGDQVVRANMNAQTNRYALLPYLYSLIYKASKTGEPVIRSIPFEFYESDKEALNVEYQFLWGQALMISPIVHENTYSKKTYLPKGRWYESNILLKKDKRDIKLPIMIDSKGEYHETVDVALDDLPLFYRGGYIIPAYTVVQQTVAQTVKNQPIALRVALCEYNGAQGELYLDEGDNIDGKHNYIRMEFAKNKLYIVQDVDEYKTEVPFGHVSILGVTSKISSVKVNDEKTVSFKVHDHILSFSLEGFSVSNKKPITVELVE